MEIAPSERELKRIYALLAVADTISTLSTCSKIHVGAVLTDKQGCILSSGYNGTPSGWPHCSDDPQIGHSMEIHAEANCICRADNTSRQTNLMLFLTHTPCIHCAKIIVASLARLDIKKIYASHVYFPNKEDELGPLEVRDYFHYSGVEMFINEKAVGRIKRFDELSVYDVSRTYLCVNSTKHLFSATKDAFDK